MSTPSPHPLTADEQAVLAVVASFARVQGTDTPLISQTAAVRVAYAGGASRVGVREAWQHLVEVGVLASTDDAPPGAHPRGYSVAPWARVLNPPAHHPNPAAAGRQGAAERAVPRPRSGYACPDCLTVLERAPRVGADGRCPECRPTVRSRRRTTTPTDSQQGWLQ